MLKYMLMEKSKGVTERTSREVQKANETFVNWLWGILKSFQDILLLHAVKYTGEKLERLCQDLFQKKAHFDEIITITKGMLRILQVILQLMLYAGTAWLIYKKQITLGTMTVVFSYYDECDGMETKEITANGTGRFFGISELSEPVCGFF